MFEDSEWNDTEVQGFQFDWDQSEQRATFSKPDSFGISSPVSFSEPRHTVIDKLTCVFCHSVLSKDIIYENQITFCSKRCWESVLRSVIDDLTVGAVSLWSLDNFFSFAAKAFLLNLACQTFDGDLIIKLLRKFEISLNPKLFERLLLENRVAYNQFMSFLRRTKQHSQLQQLQVTRGFVEHAKIQRFSEFTEQMDSIDSNSAVLLAHKLRTFASTELASDPKLNLLHETAWQLADLLYFQSQNDADWQAFKSSAQPATKELSNVQSTISLVALPLCETIRACSWLDKSLGPGSRVHQLRNQYKVADDQFRWLMIEPLVHRGDWAELDAMLLEKKWLKRQIRTLLPCDRLVMYLHSLNAPINIIDNYLSYSEDTDEMLEIATRLGMFSVALKCCVKRRDTAGMRELLSRIPKRYPEHSDILRYLALPISQWKELNKT